ncbi:hypothetical protein [Aquabacterium sp. J223]|uniref:hypothetical protein n=1 Tax=Aquabacterium sp. J223 TaxID=2898431 RepID=UPI0021AD622F|nr:hypothetical protein [Aquabacterium sp. J223]UUX94129.1 hypothetical protein LRS07_12310 [Aquabacterium sp. J223]
MRHWILVVLATALLSGRLYGAELVLSPAGPEEVVFKWEVDRCDAEDFPDSPARAYRRGDGKLVVSAAHFTNLQRVGDGFDHLRSSCRSIFRSAMDSRPDAFNARTWLQTFYVVGDDKVVALGSADYHGEWFNNCNSRGIPGTNCWWSALIVAISTDGGQSFEAPQPPHHIMARPQIEYSPDARSPTGYFTTSNIVRGRDGAYYTLVFSFGHAGQSRGVCLLRALDPAEPSQWRAFDGEAFRVDLRPGQVQGLGAQAEAGCKTMANLDAPVRSLLWHQDSGRYVAVLASWSRAGATTDAGVRIEFQTATSSDLWRWTRPRPFASMVSKSGCPRPLEDVAYPSLIDHESQDRNFGTLGSRAYVYYTRFNRPGGCGATPNRDLIRFPVRVSTNE